MRGKTLARFLCIVSPVVNSLHSQNDCFAAQIAVISTGRRPPRKRSLEWCGFLPAVSSSVARLGEGGIVLSAVAEAMAD